MARLSYSDMATRPLQTQNVPIILSRLICEKLNVGMIDRDRVLLTLLLRYS